MAHPYSDKKEEVTGRRRAEAFTGKKSTKKATGGSVSSLTIKNAGGEVSRKVVGKKSGGRLDKRARGGKTEARNSEKREEVGLDNSSPYSSDSIIKAGGAAKYARGGRTKKGHGKGNHVNIAIVNPGQKSDGPDAGGALGALGGGAKPPLMPPSLPAGAGAPPPPALGGGAPGLPPKPPGMGMPGMMNRGGKVAMKGGADTGQGRLDKAKAYGGRKLKGS